MEVVLHAVAHKQEASDDVDEGYENQLSESIGSGFGYIRIADSLSVV